MFRMKKSGNILQKDSASTYLSEGMYFNANILDSERQRITGNLLRNGYYKFNKDYISYTADTVHRTHIRWISPCIWHRIQTACPVLNPAGPSTVYD